MKCVVAVVLLAVVGCTTRLTDAPAGAVENVPAATLPAGAIGLSVANTRVSFIGSAVMNSHEGMFTRLHGYLQDADGNPEHASLSATVEMGSVYTEITLLTKHLKGADFFDVERYQLATFRSARIEPLRGDQYRVTGDFTVHGVTRRLSFPATMSITDGAVDLAAAIVVRQSDFGMDPSRSTTDDVPVTVTCHARR